ncbi:XRE family transcriptional regulator [Rhodococcus sp. IEGM 1381]|uniref:helix-turn-helix domain-containing protein n=1 Tax=Rhodococcus sp. IEGM 1381 TaxID=3047085 RepID=UPI0024B77570|nr:XRE family transcriptional regulator [Rhodococcus sp. IEGM 1381]MDI9897453.1 XRE family transcriptional regulator [Rhodococcus sp. IEGM 1381]
MGSRIRSLRIARELTVQQLADQAEVSRRLLTQIEHGQANPSLVAVTRIARSLGTDFTELLSDTVPGEAAIEVVPAEEHLLVWTSPAGSSAHLLVSTPGVRAADLWSWMLMPGDSYGGMPDAQGSFELFHVTDGQLTLTADNEVAVIAAGESARLRSDRVYRYVNDGSVSVTFFRTVALAR